MGLRNSKQAMEPPKVVEGETLVQLGHQTLEAISRFTKSIPEKKDPPEGPTDYGQILQKLEKNIFPGALSWQHPQFMAYYPSASSVPAILSETVIASIGSVGLQWKSNPIGTELEVIVMDAGPKGVMGWPVAGVKLGIGHVAGSNITVISIEFYITYLCIQILHRINILVKIP
eukprot:Skav201198  [mRNA]  locus=scaffold633:451867:453789:- [translate_table: standard]